MEAQGIELRYDDRIDLLERENISSGTVAFDDQVVSADGIDFISKVRTPDCGACRKILTLDASPKGHKCLRCVPVSTKWLTGSPHYLLSTLHPKNNFKKNPRLLRLVPSSTKWLTVHTNPQITTARPSFGRKGWYAQILPNYSEIFSRLLRLAPASTKWLIVHTKTWLNISHVGQTDHDLLETI